MQPNPQISLNTKGIVRITKKLTLVTLTFMLLACPLAYAEKIYDFIGFIDDDNVPVLIYRPLEKARLVVIDRDIFIEADSDAHSLCYMPGEYDPRSDLITNGNISYSNIHIYGEDNHSEGNTIIKGEGNISIGNTYIGGNDNVSENNTFIQGSNNLYIDNTHVAGSNSTAEENIYYGESNQIKIGEVTKGADGKNSQGEIYGYPDEKNVYVSRNNQKELEVIFGLGIIFILVFVVIIIKTRKPSQTSHEIIEKKEKKKNTNINSNTKRMPQSQSKTSLVPEPISVDKSLMIPKYTCPCCKKGTLRKIIRENGVFWGCDSYPRCVATFDDKEGTPQLNIQHQNDTQKTLTPKQPSLKKYKPKQKFGINIRDNESISSKPVQTGFSNRDIFVDVSFSLSSKHYSYFLGNIPCLKVGDFVAVYVHDKKDKNKLKLKIAHVEYISFQGEYSKYARSPLVAKADSEIMAIPKSKVFHYAWCHELVGSTDVVSYTSEDDAIGAGLKPCSKCHKW